MTERILAELRETIIEFDPDLSEIKAKKSLEAGIEPLAIMDALIDAIKEIGDAFGRGDIFLPELIGAADALEAATPMVEKAILDRGEKRQSLGKVIIGTVAGDLHTIGKSMVTSLLKAEGFEVYDLGIDVPADKFLDAVKKHNPQILAMSALLSTTAPEAKKVIELLEEAGLRNKVKVLVGGGAITAAFADQIGADGYDPTAPGAVSVAKKLMNS